MYRIASLRASHRFASPRCSIPIARVGTSLRSSPALPRRGVWAPLGAATRSVHSSSVCLVATDDVVKVPIELVKEVRKVTGAGIMMCRDALRDTHNDVDAAVSVLRTLTREKARGKLHRVASEGLLAWETSADNLSATLVEVNVETDFAARVEAFETFVHALTSGVSGWYRGGGGDAGGDDVSSMMDSVRVTVDGFTDTLENAALDAIARVGENIVFRRATRLSVPHGALGTYHTDAGGGVVEEDGVCATTQRAVAIAAIEADGPLATEEARHTVLNAAQAVAQHVATSGGGGGGGTHEDGPGTVSSVDGVLSQPSPTNESVSVQDHLNELGEHIGVNLKLNSVVRWCVGETVEKKQVDFAAEVQKQIEDAKARKAA